MIKLNLPTSTISITIFVLYGLLIAYLSLRPIELPDIVHSDKMAHFVAYAVFALMGYIAARNNAGFRMICIGIIVYGGLLELAQDQLPYRQASLFDFLANSAGVLVVAVSSTMLSGRGSAGNT